MPGTIARVSSVLVLALASFSPAAAQDGPPARQAADQGLSEALRLAPPETTVLFFTDWARIKSAKGLDILTSSIPDEFRIPAMIELTRDEAVFAGFALSRFIGHAEAWGFDSSDLAWEAQYIADGLPVNVLRFREGFALAPFEALLDERGFEARAYRDATIRSHEMDLRADWLRTTDLAILNNALLPDSDTLVLSNDVTALETALDRFADVHPNAVAATPAGAIVAEIGDAHSVAIEIGTEACQQYDARLRAGGPLDSAELVEAVGPLESWAAMAMATYRGPDREATARLLLAFPGSTAEVLAAELAARERLAREGLSMRSGEPYADTMFKVSDASAAGDIVDIGLVPLDGSLATFLRAALTRDMVAAACDRRE